jgi:hypothetical protein
MRKTLYYEAVCVGLVRVHRPVLVEANPWQVEVTVAENKGAFSKGEHLRVYREALLHKAGTCKDGTLMVTPAHL